MKLIAKKRIPRKRAGEEFSVNASIGRALVALGYASKPTADKPKQAKPAQTKQVPTYQRRDMVAEQPAAAAPRVEEYWTPKKS